MHLTVASGCRKSDFVTLNPNGCWKIHRINNPSSINIAFEF